MTVLANTALGDGLVGNVSFSTSLPSDSPPVKKDLDIRQSSSQPPVPLESLFSFPQFQKGLLRGMVWDLPSEDDIAAFRSYGKCSAAVMDTFGKVFYDTHFSQIWAHLGPSDDPPSLFLPTQDLCCLETNFDSKKPPSEIFNDSYVLIWSKTIMSKVCQGLRSSSARHGHEAS
jgi:hypothetical protein